MHQPQIYYTQNDVRSDRSEMRRYCEHYAFSTRVCVMTCSKIAVDAAHSPILTTAATPTRCTPDCSMPVPNRALYGAETGHGVLDEYAWLRRYSHKRPGWRRLLCQGITEPMGKSAGQECQIHRAKSAASSHVSLLTRLT